MQYNDSWQAQRRLADLYARSLVPPAPRRDLFLVEDGPLPGRYWDDDRDGAPHTPGAKPVQGGFIV